jgi:hypothetical protein
MREEQENAEICNAIGEMTMAKRLTSNPRRFEMLLNVSIPKTMAEALSAASSANGGLLSIPDFVRLSLHEALERGGYYTAANGHAQAEHRAA